MAAKFADIVPFARKLQLRLAELFEDEGVKDEEIKYTLAVDVAYNADIAECVGIKYNIEKGKVERKWTLKSSVFFPYVAGYFYLREAPPIIRLLERVDESYDIILIDAHGILHPRKAGLATIVGILAAKPTIGIAKSRLVGKVEKMNERVSGVTVKGEVLGYLVGDRKNGFYVSQGNMISQHEMLKFIARRGYRYPEELKIVDNLTKKISSE
jgi:deoxyribonuclease V